MSKDEKKLVDQQKAELLVLEKEHEKGEALVETQRDKISFLEKSIEKLTETFSVEGELCLMIIVITLDLVN